MSNCSIVTSTDRRDGGTVNDLFLAVDIHAHYLSDDALSAVSALSGDDLRVEDSAAGAIIYVDGNRYGPLPQDLTVPERQIESLAERGVGHALLSPPPFLLCYGTEPAFAEEFAIAQNEATAALVQSSDGSLSGLATIPLQHPERAGKLLKHAVDELGLTGVEIGTHVAGRNLDDASFEPFWKQAAELDALVFIHPTDVRGIQFDDEYYLRNLLGNSLETSYALARIIFGGVLERYANLKILAAHAGGFLPYSVGRLDRGYECRRECADTIPRPPSTYLNQINFDSVNHAAPALAYLIELVGADHVALGFDFPFDMGDPMAIDRLSTLPVAQRGQVAYRTARTLLA